MAKFSFRDGDITINAVNLSDHVANVTLETSSDALETTAMGNTYRERIGGGLNDWSLTLEFQQDFAASEVDATLFPLLGTSTAITVKATSAATSATNPEFQGNVIVSDYTPLSGAVDDVATLSVTWPGAGTLTRATS